MLESVEGRTAIVLVAAFCIYLIPTIIATLRQRPNVVGIALVNVLAGWTVIGWVFPLIWAFSNDGLTPNRAPAARTAARASPIEYVPTSQREAIAALTDAPPPQRPKFADAEQEARAAHRASQQPGGGAWS